MKNVYIAIALLILALAAGGRADSSAGGTFVDLSFAGRLRVEPTKNQQAAVVEQVLYIIGQLNGYSAGALMDKLVVVLGDVRRVDGQLEISYSATLPAIWKTSVRRPKNVDLTLPLDVSRAGQQSFAARYGRTCVDIGAFDVTADSMFYFFRPQKSGCKFSPADVYRVTATVSSSTLGATGKFPEYDRVWADGAFRSVVIFDRYETGATSSNDAGISAYNTFVSMMKRELGRYKLMTVPATVPSRPGPSQAEVQFKAALPNGRQIDAVVLLADGVPRMAKGGVRARYDALSTNADLIVYNGHSEFGANLRSLGAAGQWTRGQYAIMFLNSQDSASFLDGTLIKAHRAVNGDDPTGFKYLDLVTNGMPNFFATMPTSTMALWRALASPESRQSYEQILAAMDPNQLAMVMGDQDNATAAQQPPWPGLDASGTVTKSQSKEWSTPMLPAGSYTFTLSGSGDADLYVRVGSAPTTSSYDCRPAKSGSDESCQIQLAQSAAIFVMVRGYAPSSTFQIVGRRN